MLRVVAVDFGATSVRVAEVDLDDPGADPVILHRVPNQPIRDRGGTLRWDWPRLMEAVRVGIARARSRDGGAIASIGVDTWGVDYGLIDRDGRLIASPVSYRDERTVRDGALRALDPAELFRRTGVEPAPIATIAQLAAHDREELAGADRVLMLPELIVHELTGAVLAERSSAGTSGLVELSTGQWSGELMDAAGIPLTTARFPPVERAGRVAGTVDGIPVVLGLGHDTAAAIAALPAPTGSRAFVSSGSWLVVGTERTEALVTREAFGLGVTNERLAGESFAVARNLPGFVIVERLRRQWGGPELGGLLSGIAGLGRAGTAPDAATIADLEGAALEEALAVASGSSHPTRPELLRLAIASLAHTAAEAIAAIGRVTDIAFTEVALVGGGVRVPLFRELLEHATGLPVVAGAAESAVVGNALVQAAALGLRQPVDPNAR